MKLDDQLKSVLVPPCSPGYWEAFPKRVTARINSPPLPRPAGWLPWAIGLATACLVVALGIGGWTKSRQTQRTDYAKIYREVQALFPNQVQAIVVDAHGVNLVLADSANAPASPPLLVQACAPAGCQAIITFSGQQVKMNGDRWDVLLNGQDRVIVAGRSTPQYRIEARLL